MSYKYSNHSERVGEKRFAICYHRTDEDRTFFLIDIPCHPDFLKEEEVVTTLSQPCLNLSQPVSTLYQAWVSAMEEVTKTELQIALSDFNTLSQPCPNL